MVWESFTRLKGLKITDAPIVFEDVRFLRSSVLRDPGK